MRRNFPAAPQIDMTAGDNFLAVKQHNANLNFPGSVTAEAISICRGEGEKKRSVAVRAGVLHAANQRSGTIIWPDPQLRLRRATGKQTLWQSHYSDRVANRSPNSPIDTLRPSGAQPEEVKC